MHFSDFLSAKDKIGQPDDKAYKLSAAESNTSREVQSPSDINIKNSVVQSSPETILRSDSFVQTTREVAGPVQGVGNEILPSVIQLNQILVCMLKLK